MDFFLFLPIRLFKNASNWRKWSNANSLPSQKNSKKTSARTRNWNKKWQTICRLKFSRKDRKKKIGRFYIMKWITQPFQTPIIYKLGCGTINITYKKLYTYLKYKSIIQLSCVRSNKEWKRTKRYMYNTLMCRINVCTRLFKAKIVSWLW